VAEQALRRLEYLHSKGFLHRDIKPENFLFGLGERAHHLYLIDFGLSKRYYDGKHVQPRSRKLQPVGTARYASINALSGSEQSRRDDLEALGYLLVYLLQGSLPWSGLQPPTHETILAKKQAVKLPELCAGLPGAFEAYLRATRALDFEERPDYEALRGLFRKLREGHDFEWLGGQGARGRAPLQPWGRGPKQPDDDALEPRLAAGAVLMAWLAQGLAACSCNAKGQVVSDTEEESCGSGGD